jgi:5-methylcytosine-specific restriction endonuclease McrA
MPIDYSRYPSNWKTEIRPAILERDENCCKFCGVGNGHIVIRGKAYMNNDAFFNTTTQKYHLINGVAIDADDFKATTPKQVKVVLTIAHLDHDEDNHNVKLDRLAALCQKCHLDYDRAEKKRRRKEKKGLRSLFDDM